MTKPRYKTTNWKHYNKALINRGTLTFWIDEEAITEWKQKNKAIVAGHADSASETSFFYAIDSTSLKVFGEGEKKVKKHVTDGKRRVWRKLHIPVDISTHEIVATELSLSSLTDAECFSTYLNRLVAKSSRYQVMALMTQGIAIMLYGSSELFR